MNHWKNFIEFVNIASDEPHIPSRGKKNQIPLLTPTNNTASMTLIPTTIYNSS
jgi:hypothetical protein